MTEIYREACALMYARTAFAAATVIETWGSAPRKRGAHMLIAQDQIVGSVSGGCVENDVYAKGLEVIETGNSAVVGYGVSDENAWNVGLSCGGSLKLFIESFSPEVEQDQQFWNTIRQSIEQDTGCVVARELGDNAQFREIVLPQAWKTGKLADLEEQAYYQRAHALAERDGKQYFIEIVAPKHTLLIFGAAHIASELVRLAKPFGFKTVVIDPRGFNTGTLEFSDAPDVLEEGWPAEVMKNLTITPYTYAVTLSHDPKIDDQALEILLTSEVAYIGALGSRKTHAKRLDRLRAVGFDDNTLERIDAPVGIDIKAQSAKEIALSILAGLVHEKNRFIS